MYLVHTIWFVLSSLSLSSFTLLFSKRAYLRAAAIAAFAVIEKQSSRTSITVAVHVRAAADLLLREREQHRIPAQRAICRREKFLREADASLSVEGFQALVLARARARCGCMCAKTC